MDYYPTPPPVEGQLFTPNYVADTKLEYLIRMSNHFKVPIEHLPHHLGHNYWLTIVYYAIIAGDLIEMDRIMFNHGIPIDVPLYKNLTPIWFACQYGQFHIVQNLLLKKANVNIYDRDIKMSCLDMAISRKFKKCAYLLLAYGAKTFNKLAPVLDEEAAAIQKI